MNTNNISDYFKLYVQTTWYPEKFKGCDSEDIIWELDENGKYVYSVWNRIKVLESARFGEDFQD